MRAAYNNMVSPSPDPLTQSIFFFQFLDKFLLLPWENALHSYWIIYHGCGEAVRCSAHHTLVPAAL